HEDRRGAYRFFACLGGLRSEFEEAAPPLAVGGVRHQSARPRAAAPLEQTYRAAVFGTPEWGGGGGVHFVPRCHDATGVDAALLRQGAHLPAPDGALCRHGPPLTLGGEVADAPRVRGAGRGHRWRRPAGGFARANGA